MRERELTVRIRFKRHCLGNCKAEHGGKWLFSRSPAGAVLFMATWHKENMRFAARMANRHQRAIEQILWDIEVDSGTPRRPWYNRYYSKNGKERYVIHESFPPGHEVGINCIVPAEIADDDLWTLFDLVGRYRGISPYGPTEFGLFDVVSIRPRRE